jgi:hypothetical protein
VNIFSFLFGDFFEDIREMLRAWIVANFEGIFESFNKRAQGLIADIVLGPKSFMDGSIYDTVKGITDSVVLPVAGMIITFVAMYELITMIIDKNHMNEVESFMFFKWVVKTMITIYVVSNIFAIVNGFFEIVTGMVEIASKDANIDVLAMKQDFATAVAGFDDIGALLALALETMLFKTAMVFMSGAIIFVTYGRMIDIYVTLSVAPIPVAGLGNREFGQIGVNYLKAFFAFALQGFFMVICILIYKTVVTDVDRFSAALASGDINEYMLTIAGVTIALIFALFRSGGVAKSIVGAH